MVENEGTLFCSEMLFDGAPLKSVGERQTKIIFLRSSTNQLSKF